MKDEDNVTGVKVTGDGVQKQDDSPNMDKPVGKGQQPQAKETQPEIDLSHFVSAFGHPRKWVIVRDTGGANESKQPLMGLNGFLIKCQRNVPVHIPIPILNAMKLCVYKKIERDEVTGDEIVRNIPRFSFEDVPSDQIPNEE